MEGLGLNKRERRGGGGYAFKFCNTLELCTKNELVQDSGTPEVCLLPAGMADKNKLIGAVSSSVCKYYNNNKILTFHKITGQYGSTAVRTVVKVSSSVCKY